MVAYKSYQDYVSGEIRRMQFFWSGNIPDTGVISHVFGPAQDQDKKANRDGYSVTQSVSFLEMDSQGIYGDRHRRLTRSATVRERDVFPKGTIIREHRHIFAVSLRDCENLSTKLGVNVTPELLGANLVIEGDEGPYSLSALPQGTDIQVYSEEQLVAVLRKQVTQKGCGVTGNAIRAHYNLGADITQKFIEVSEDTRGVVCSVETPVDHLARIEPGQKVVFKFPTGFTI